MMNPILRPNRTARMMTESEICVEGRCVTAALGVGRTRGRGTLFRGGAGWKYSSGVVGGVSGISIGSKLCALVRGLMV
jgi:hypothetical protein